MATSIRELNEISDYEANSSWMLIEHNSALYRIKSSILLDSYAIQSEYIDSNHSNVSFQDSSFSFSKQNLGDTLSSFIVNLEFGDKYRLPSVTIVKNSGDAFCRILTFEGAVDLNAGSSSGILNLSKYISEDQLQTNIIGSISLSANQISIDSLRLTNISDSPSTNSAYCCASIKSRILNA